MSIDRKDDGFLSRWSKRKQDAREAPDEVPAEDTAALTVADEPEPETEEEALDLLRERDPELAEQISGIDIDTLTYDDDFSVFMNKKVPEFIRRKALSKLWLSNPILANVDGLNDYDEDFTDAGSVIETLQTAFSKGGEGSDTDELAGQQNLVKGECAPEDDKAVEPDEEVVELADDTDELPSDEEADEQRHS